MTNLESLVILNMVNGLGSIKLKALLDRFGSPKKILNVSKEELRDVFGIGSLISENIAKVSKGIDLNLNREFDLIKKNGIKLITIWDESYPSNLKEIYDPPILLYTKGELLPQDVASVAIVGSRRASFYGQETSEKLSCELAGLGITIVSGMARGIDTAAHKGALRAGGRTIAVLGSGLSCIYPPENKKLSEEISQSGAVISEFSMETHPARENFPRRNRIISGMSLGVVVVEAWQRSGALITANLALEQGREVFAVPGKVSSFTSRGTHSLIKEGAKLVSSIEDIIEELKPILQNYKKGGEVKEKSIPFQPNLDEEENTIYSLLSSEPQHIDEIAKLSNFPISRISSILVRLEIKKLVRQLPGKVFIKK